MQGREVGGTRWVLPTRTNEGRRHMLRIRENGQTGTPAVTNARSPETMNTSWQVCRHSRNREDRHARNSASLHAGYLVF
jgi:hypothetical protein